MGTRDPRVDAYIERSAEFARPILGHIRETVHAACPEVEETMKWSFPHFTYHGMLASMASFKAHCAFGFWKGDLVLGGRSERDAMGDFGRLTALSDLPADRALIACIKKAARLNDEGVKLPRKPAAAKKELKIPADFTAALDRNRTARATFDGFNYTNRKDYVEWVTEAKTEATRQKRLLTAIEWMAEGKVRNWKYVRC